MTAYDRGVALFIWGSCVSAVMFAAIIGPLRIKNGYMGILERLRGMSAFLILCILSLILAAASLIWQHHALVSCAVIILSAAMLIGR